MLHEGSPFVNSYFLMPQAGLDEIFLKGYQFVSKEVF
jgi:hypothetical protein